MSDANTSTKKLFALIELEKALIGLKEAWRDAAVAIDNVYIDANDYILGEEGTDTQYPFHLSFDEMYVGEWVDGCVEKIEAAMEDLQTS